LKPTLILTFIILLLACSTTYAQVFYQYPGAPTVEPKHVDVGAYLSGGDDLFRLGGYGRIGFARYWDVGIEGLVESFSSDWRGGLGVDIRYQLLPTTDKLPFDLSADAGFGFVSGNGVTLYQAPVGAVISSPLTTENDMVITPYLGVYAAFVRTKVEVAGSSDVTDNDVEPLLRGGASIRFGEQLEFFLTLQLGPNDLLAIGANFHL